MGKQSRLLEERKNTPQKSRPYKIALRLELTFTKAEAEALQEFQETINIPDQPALSLEQICRKSIFWAVNEAYKRGKELSNKMAAGEEKTSEQIQTGDAPRDSVPPSPSTDADSSTLANSQDPTTQGV